MTGFEGDRTALSTAGYIGALLGVTAAPSPPQRALASLSVTL